MTGPGRRAGAPVLLLDVDGVLNALVRELPTGWHRGVFRGYTLTWDPSITQRLRGWHERGLVELQWLTTWTREADRLLAEPMGLPRGLRVHDRDDEVGATGFAGTWGGAGGWWKLALAQRVAANDVDRRIVWIDDDLADQAEDTAGWLAANAHVLVVAPELTVGLTHAHLDRVEAWLGEPGGVNPAAG